MKQLKLNDKLNCLKNKVILYKLTQQELFFFPLFNFFFPLFNFFLSLSYYSRIVLKNLFIIRSIIKSMLSFIFLFSFELVP